MSNQEQTRLIILGAGASVECGFYPTGAQLIELARKILQLSKSEIKEKKQLVNFESKSPDLTDDHRQEKENKAKKIDNEIKITKKQIFYLNNLINSGHSSIDSHIAYIEDEDEKKFLKLFIYCTILHCTSYSLIQENFEDCWYSEIVKLILPTIDSSSSEETIKSEIEKKLKNIQIITFNYDISLEIFLKKALEKFLGKKSKLVEEIFKLICGKIHHVYGKIADVEEILKIDFSFFESYDSLMLFFDKTNQSKKQKPRKNFIYYLRVLTS